MKSFYLYITALFLFFLLDMIWLNLFAQGFYARLLSGLMLEKPNVMAAGLFYLIYPIGLIVLVIHPGLQSGASPWEVCGKGMLLGLMVYAGYDLTNLAILKGWSVLLSAVDVLWGTLVSGGVCLSTFLIFKRFFA